MTIEVKMTLKENSRKYLNAVPQAFAETFVTTAELILGMAIPLTPLKYNALRSSKHVKPPEITNSEVKVEFGFATDYAWTVHEWNDPHPVTGKPINWSEPGTGPKYLETPLRDEMKNFSRTWDASLKRKLSGIYGS